MRELELDAYGDNALALLVTLFLLGGAVGVDRLTAAGLDVAGLAERGVLSVSGDGADASASALVIVDRLDDVYAIGDRVDDNEQYVASVSPSTRLSAAFMPVVEVERALDVGTGSGALALLAAPHAREVVATDINPRALEYTALNAELNGVGNITMREGSYFEPVRGERFGLIVANPPYVVVPDGKSLYRDSGSGTDSLSRNLLRELPLLLEEGGWGVLQGNWAHGVDEPWHAPIGSCLTGSGCDAFLVRVSTESALSYAARWSEYQHGGDPDGYRERIAELRRAYEESGLERISGAMVVLRKRSGAPQGNWRRATTLGARPVGLRVRLPALAAAQDRLETGDLADAVLCAPPGLDVEHHRRPGEAARCVLQLQSAPTTRRPVAPELGDLVLRLDGTTPLGEVASDVPLRDVEVLVKTGYLDFA